MTRNGVVNKETLAMFLIDMTKQQLFIEMKLIFLEGLVESHILSDFFLAVAENIFCLQKSFKCRKYYSCDHFDVSPLSILFYFLKCILINTRLT